MASNKKIYILLSLLVLSIIITTIAVNLEPSSKQPKISASWVENYTNEKTLVDKSDLIVVGKLEKSIPEKRVDMIFTKQFVKIDKYIKGDKLLNDIVQILQTGGELNGEKTFEIQEAPLFNQNDKYLLFLQKTNEGHYLVMGGYQGAGKILNGKFKPNIDNDELGKVLKDKSLEDIEKAVN